MKKGQFKIAALSVFVLPFAVAQVAEAQQLSLVQSCSNSHPGPAGKACCIKVYSAYTSFADQGRRAYELQTCIDNASSKKK